MPTYQNSYHAKQNAQRANSQMVPAGFWGPNWTMPGTNAASNAGTYAGDPNSLKNWFSKLKSKTSGASSKLSGLADLDNYGWSKGSGLKAFGKNVGKWGNIAGVVVQGVDALQGISDYQNAIDENDDLMSKIRVSAMGNPLLSSYLTQDQINLLGQVQRGSYDTEADAGDFFKGALGGLGSAIIPTLSGLAVGGIPGAVIGGVGSLINSGIDNLSASSGQNTAELQALYQALQDADAQYRSMKRPNFTGLGIQQQYQNMYA